jgi:ABC-type multidrug transport system ATPase subunit
MSMAKKAVSVEGNTFFAFFGPTGSGKSTAMRQLTKAVSHALFEN